MSPVDVAVRGSIVLAVGLLVCLALRGRAPALRHAVLVVALAAAPLVAPLGLLLPPMDVALPRFAALARSAATPATPGASPEALASASLDAEATAGPASPLAGDEPGRSTQPGAGTRPVRSWSIGWATIALGIWALGSALLLGSLVAALMRLAHATRLARPIADARWSEALATAARATGLRRAVNLRESPRPDLLATWGWRTPCLLVPTDALDWSLERMRIVLGHELAHVQRVDWAWQILGAVVRAAFWWNPLAWLASHRLSVEAERACDDAVLALGVAPHTYARELVAVARALRVSPSLPAIAVSMARPSTLHTRITAMLNPHLQRSTPGRLTTTLLVGAVLALLVPVAAIRGAIAQAPLEGVVYDSTGAVVPDVRLSLDANGRKVEATTDAEGRFAFPAVEPGAYVLASATPGFKLLRQKVDLKQPADWTRVITLQLGDVKETINVKGRRGSGVAAPATGPVRVRVGGNIKPPRKLVDVKPIYPDASQEAGHEGTVEIEAVIGRDGTVDAARVTSPEVYPELAAAAIEAVRKWKFSPTLLNGGPVEVVMNVSVSFTLE